MTAGSLIIGLGAGIACLGIARMIGRSIARIEFAIDDAWGDVPFLNGELAGDRGFAGGDGDLAAAHLSERHIAHDDPATSR